MTASSVPKVPRQRLGRGLADMADAQAEQETRQGGLLRSFQRLQHVLRRLLGHAIQAGQREVSPSR
jgi:hypothetical protein